MFGLRYPLWITTGSLITGGEMSTLNPFEVFVMHMPSEKLSKVTKIKVYTMGLHLIKLAHLTILSFPFYSYYFKEY